MKIFYCFIFLLLLFSCNNDRLSQRADRNTGDLDTTTDIYSVSAEDVSMNGAINKAKQSLDEFDKALASDNPSFSNFSIKKPYKAPDGGAEHIWIAGIRMVNGGYKGYINNDVESAGEVKYGDTVIVQRNDITDWMYLDKNVLRGGYTIREIRNNLNKADRMKMDQELSFTIEED